MMKCQSCGVVAREEQAFCGSCGQRFPKPEPGPNLSVTDSILKDSDIDAKRTVATASMGDININLWQGPAAGDAPLSPSVRTSGQCDEGAVVNPRYHDDLHTLDGYWDLSRVITHETVFIVTGCNVISELLDRPVAAVLRNAIDRLGAGTHGRRAIVIGDLCWQSDWDGDLSHHPMICLGGPPVVREVAAAGEKWTDGGIHWSRIAGPPARVALWGDLAAQTRDAVLRFLSSEDGLHRFLRRVWPNWSH